MQADERCRTVCRWMTAVYIIAGIGLMTVYALQKNWYLTAQSAGTLAVLAAFFGIVKLIKIKPVYSLYAIVIAFTFASYTLGVACRVYKILPLYDKVLHMASGTLVMMFAPILFYVLKDGYAPQKSDCRLAVCFCIAVSLSVAGLWEIAEYILSILTDIDPQNVLASGVSDTMIDMIVCTVGTVLAVPPLIRLYRTGNGGLLYMPMQIFIEKNFARREE